MFGECGSGLGRELSLMFLFTNLSDYIVGQLSVPDHKGP